MIRYQRLKGSGGSRALAAGIFLFAAAPVGGQSFDLALPITEIVVRGNQTTDEALVLRQEA